MGGVQGCCQVPGVGNEEEAFFKNERTQRWVMMEGSRKEDEPTSHSDVCWTHPWDIQREVSSRQEHL